MKAIVNGTSHAHRVFEAPSTGDSICTARIDDDSTYAFTGSLLKDFSADSDWGSLEFVFGKNGSSRAGDVRCYESKVWKLGITWLDSDMDTCSKESLWIRPCRRDILLFRRRDCACHRGGKITRGRLIARARQTKPQGKGCQVVSRPEGIFILGATCLIS